MMYKNILETIGNTPLVQIQNIFPKKDIDVFAKIEGVNPGGSIKDRAALMMVEKAEESGELTKDKIIIEPTSGNTGIALAMIGAVKGYQVKIVMSEAVSEERRKIMEVLGAEIILTGGAMGTDGAIIRAHEIVDASPDKYFMPDQFSNQSNPGAHYHGTAQEIWEQMEGKIDYFVTSLGTSGTVMGIGKKLKEYDPNITIVEAHPEKGHGIQGLKNMEEAINPKIYSRDVLDQTIIIKTKDAISAAQEIMKKEGILVGMSSGAAVVAVREVIKNVESARIVTIFPDRAEKYVSTELFS